MQTLKTGIIPGITSAIACVALLALLVAVSPPAQPIKATLSIEGQPDSHSELQAPTSDLPPPPTLRWSCYDNCGGLKQCPNCEAAAFRPKLIREVVHGR